MSLETEVESKERKLGKKFWAIGMGGAFVCMVHVFN